jgi:quercetin dioxygenase-like cupin family protein
MGEVLVKRAVDTTEEVTPWGRLLWKASGALGNSQAMTVGICEIHPGAENPRHVHANCEEVLHVLQGTIVHSYGDDGEVTLYVGEVITIPAHVMHHARNIGEDTAVLAISFSNAARLTHGE